MAVDDGREHAEEELVAQVARGTLNAQGAARLERHLADCATCVAELEAVRLFHVSVAPGPDDEVLDDVALEGALARLAELGDEKGRLGRVGRHPDDEALDRVAVDRAMAVIGQQDGAKRRQRRWQVAGLAVFGAAAAATLVATVTEWPPATTRSAAVAVVAPPPLVLADGSEILPDAPATPVQVKEQTAARTVVRLSSGAARFRVKHDARRLFQVDAGPIRIEDLGTVFRVAHQRGGGVRVVVSEGRVAVLSSASGARVELGAGDERVFFAPAPTTSTTRTTIDATPSAPQGLGAALAEEPAAAPPPSALAPAAAPSSPAPPPVRGQPRVHPEEGPAELLAAADVARRSRDPRAAVAPLRRLVQRHPKDPRAPSAAFTLGWVLLTDLDRPREAAGAFADAERLAPRGALAEDAAARIAEAWQSAGEPRRAAEAARRYEQMYPTGRYVGLMHGLIGKHDGKN